MMLWIAVIAGIVFAVVGIRRGLCPTWALVFNILIAIYLSVMLTPAMLRLFDDADGFQYHRPICVAALAIAFFGILQAGAIVLIGTFEASLPRMFDIVGSGVLGFLSGYLACVFFLFVFFVITF